MRYLKIHIDKNNGKFYCVERRSIVSKKDTIRKNSRLEQFMSVNFTN